MSAARGRRWTKTSWRQDGIYPWPPDRLAIPRVGNIPEALDVPSSAQKGPQITQARKENPGNQASGRLG
jgi:hypothetical protein